MGLDILYPKPGETLHAPLEIEYGIVAVHGLNGDPKKTWTHPKSRTSWLEEYLPGDMRAARIMSFGYNADAAFGNTTASIKDHAVDLLGSLIDVREEAEVSCRSIIFIAHSLGGIIVKKALVWAHIESRYEAIKVHTKGVVFFATPHRGSEKADYGKVLVNVATGVLNRPRSQLINALKANSDTLQDLTSDFKFQAPNYQVVSFYELKPMSIFSKLIVEKHSALLEINNEDQQPVDSNHSEICKFGSREDETYQKLVKRLKRIAASLHDAEVHDPKFYNKYFEVPLNPSPKFTGRDDIRSELAKACLPSQASSATTAQKVFVIYGLGGSGKTQVALKFAHDYRERFWGVFFVDVSSKGAAETSLSAIAEKCRSGNTVESFKRFLTNSAMPWLLILDNADNPSLEVAQYFPLGNRGTMVVTSRDPQRRKHETVGSRELLDMGSDEAISLLLRSADLDRDDERLRIPALPIVQTLGCLALAIAQAGASIFQGICSLTDYLEMYKHSRTELLSERLSQTPVGYEYTVYTTREISVRSIRHQSEIATDHIASDALELLNLFGFLHFDDITEEIIESAWRTPIELQQYPWLKSNLIRLLRDDRHGVWDPIPFREAITLLSRYSLIQLSQSDRRIALHPLVHSWIRDSLSEEAQLKWWVSTFSTMTLGSKPRMDHFQGQLLLHARHCMSVRNAEDFFVDGEFATEKIKVSRILIESYIHHHQGHHALAFAELAVVYTRRFLGESVQLCAIATRLADIYNTTCDYQKASDLLEEMLSISIRVVGATSFVTSDILQMLSRAYTRTNRILDAQNIIQKCLAIYEELGGEKHPRYSSALRNLASVKCKLGQHDQALKLLREAKKLRKELLMENGKSAMGLEVNIALEHVHLGRYGEAREILEKLLKTYSEILGETHYFTARVLLPLGYVYGRTSQPEKAVPLIVKGIEIGTKLDTINDTELHSWKECLEEMQAQIQDGSRYTPPEPPPFQRTEHKMKAIWRLWPKRRHQIEGSFS